VLRLLDTANVPSSQIPVTLMMVLSKRLLLRVMLVVANTSCRKFHRLVDVLIPHHVPCRGHLAAHNATDSRWGMFACGDVSKLPPPSLRHVPPEAPTSHPFGNFALFCIFISIFAFSLHSSFFHYFSLSAWLIYPRLPWDKADRNLELSYI
jgi:hypothetical protein